MLYSVAYTVSISLSLSILLFLSLLEESYIFRIRSGWAPYKNLQSVRLVAVKLKVKITYNSHCKNE